MMTTDEFRIFVEKKADEVFSEETQCFLRGVTLNADGEVCLWLGDSSVADMAGAIRLARRVFPNCEVVRTMAGDTADTVYAKRQGKWFSFEPDDLIHPMFPEYGYTPKD